MLLMSMTFLFIFPLLYLFNFFFLNTFVLQLFPVLNPKLSPTKLNYFDVNQLTIINFIEGCANYHLDFFVSLLMNVFLEVKKPGLCLHFLAFSLQLHYKSENSFSVKQFIYFRFMNKFLSSSSFNIFAHCLNFRKYGSCNSLLRLHYSKDFLDKYWYLIFSFCLETTLSQTVHSLHVDLLVNKLLIYFLMAFNQFHFLLHHAVHSFMVNQINSRYIDVLLLEYGFETQLLCPICHTTRKTVSRRSIVAVLAARVVGINIILVLHLIVFLKMVFLSSNILEVVLGPGQARINLFILIQFLKNDSTLFQFMNLNNCNQLNYRSAVKLRKRSLMKASTQHLTEHHKQQYMKYLEAQLERFCAFMLQQKKQNQKNRNILESAINVKTISQLMERIKKLQLYQRQNFMQLQSLESKYDSHQFQNRIKRLQNEHGQHSYSNKNKENSSKFTNSYTQNQKFNVCKCQQISQDVKGINKGLLKRIKKLEEQIKNINSNQTLSQIKIQENDIYKTKAKSKQSEAMMTNYSELNSVHNSAYPQKSLNKNEIQLVKKKQLKRIENNISQMFEKKWKKMENMWNKLIFLNNKGFIKQQSSIQLNDEQNYLLKNQIHDFNSKIQKDQSQSCFKYSNSSIPSNRQRLRPVHEQSLLKTINSQFMTNKQSNESQLSRKAKRKNTNKSKSKSYSKSKSKSKKNKNKEKRNSQRQTPLSQYRNSEQSIITKDISNFLSKQRVRSRSKSQKKSSVFNFKSQRLNQKSQSKSAKSSISPNQRNFGNKNGKNMQKIFSKEYRTNCVKNHV